MVAGTFGNLQPHGNGRGRPVDDYSGNPAGQGLGDDRGRAVDDHSRHPADREHESGQGRPIADYSGHPEGSGRVHTLAPVEFEDLFDGDLSPPHRSTTPDRPVGLQRRPDITQEPMRFVPPTGRYVDQSEMPLGCGDSYHHWICPNCFELYGPGHTDSRVCPKVCGACRKKHVGRVSAPFFSGLSYLLS